MMWFDRSQEQYIQYVGVGPMNNETKRIQNPSVAARLEVFVESPLPVVAIVASTHPFPVRDVNPWRCDELCTDECQTLVDSGISLDD